MGEEHAPRAQIDWASAEVEDGVLRVPLTGEPSKALASRIAHVVERLAGHGGGPWEAIAVTRERVEVTGVQAGTEGDVRHVLEAAVTQANADLAPDPDEDARREGSAADREMADAFRSFAEDPGD
jgi:hypothetical protein